jgi:hypothetical protein
MLKLRRIQEYQFQARLRLAYLAYNVGYGPQTDLAECVRYVSRLVKTQ